VFLVVAVVVDFVIDSARKLLDTPSYVVSDFTRKLPTQKWHILRFSITTQKFRAQHLPQLVSLPQMKFASTLFLMILLKSIKLGLRPVIKFHENLSKCSKVMTAKVSGHAYESDRQMFSYQPQRYSL
jgi:hypothetical protein